MRNKAAKKLRQYAKRDFFDLFQMILRMSFKERVKIAFRIVFKV